MIVNLYVTNNIIGNRQKAPCPKYCDSELRLHFTCKVKCSSGVQALEELRTSAAAPPPP